MQSPGKPIGFGFLNSKWNPEVFCLRMEVKTVPSAYLDIQFKAKMNGSNAWKISISYKGAQLFPQVWIRRGLTGQSKLTSCNMAGTELKITI